MKISQNNTDISLLTVNLLTYRIFTRLPMNLIKSAQETASLCTLAGGAVCVFAIYLLSICFFKQSHGNILDTVQTVFGVWGKIIVSLIFAVYLVLSLCFALNDFSRLVNLIAFPASPLWFVSGFLVLGGILGALCNTSSLVRLHGVFMPVVIIIFALLVGSTLFTGGKNDDIPILAANTVPPLKEFLSQAVLYGDIILLFLIYPTNESKGYMAKKIGRGGVFALILNTMFILAFTLKIPPTIARGEHFPVYLLMKEVYFGRFFQRLDAFVLLICAISSMLYISLNLNLISQVLNQGLRLSKSRIIPPIIGGTAFAFVLNQWILPKDSLLNLIYIFSFGVLGILVLTAVFIGIRRVLNEKS